jgi:hypothetical protein
MITSIAIVRRNLLRIDIMQFVKIKGKEDSNKIDCFAIERRSVWVLGFTKWDNPAKWEGSLLARLNPLR